MITINQRPYFLEFKVPFGTAHGMRKGTDCILTEVACQGLTGYGEAALPPYLEDTVETVTQFLYSIDLKSFMLPEDFESVLNHVMQHASGSFPAKAAVDMALFDLMGKMTGQSCHNILGLDAGICPPATYTIGLANEADLAANIAEGAGFPMLKIKAGGLHDKQRIKRIAGQAKKPFCVDANQGWKDQELALDMIRFVMDLGAVFVEQPLEKNNVSGAAWLKERSPLPVIADESFQTLDDLERVMDSFHGVNVKLMKCGGMRSAYAIMKQARLWGLKIMLGCMSESSCAVSAAAQLMSMADWVDLDGPLLIGNDPFEGIAYDQGRIVLSDRPGNGVRRK